MNKGGVAAVDRALSILVAFEPDGTAQALTEIAAKTGMYKSTILRLMISLERFNCVLRLADVDRSVVLRLDGTDGDAVGVARAGSPVVEGDGVARLRRGH